MILSKPLGRMQQAAMEESVNVLSSVIFIIKRADAFHCDGRQYFLSHFWRDLKSLFGVLGSGMLQDGLAVNLGELLSSYVESREYLVTSQQRREAKDNLTAVGAIRSTRSAGKPRTWGRDCGEGADGSALGFHITQRVA
jgi:hypothetical protein